MNDPYIYSFLLDLYIDQYQFIYVSIRLKYNYIFFSDMFLFLQTLMDA